MAEVADIEHHLVLFIHGIGAQSGRYGNMDHHVSTIQSNTNEIIQNQYPDHNICVEYVPIEWHSPVHDLVDNKVDKSTLSTVPKVRFVTNHWVMDSVYYFSKPYGQYIVDVVCRLCQEAYENHARKHAAFGERGQVHIIGFSLGGIIAYDILAKQWRSEDGEVPWKDVDDKDYVCRQSNFNIPHLSFRVNTLFTCGSPLAATLIARGLDYLHYRPPPYTKLFNIFHPFDPLGYRIEPMVNEAYRKVHPVRLRRAQRRRLLPRIPDLGIRSSIAGAAPLLGKARRSFWQLVASEKGPELADNSALQADRYPRPRLFARARSTAVFASASTPDLGRDVTDTKPFLRQDTLVSPSTPLSSNENEQGDVPLLDDNTKVSDCSATSSYVTTVAIESDDMANSIITDVESESPIPSMDEQSLLGCDGKQYPRTDYVLNENVIDAYASEWIVALKSHFRYWANRDVALHIVDTLIGE